MSSVFKLALLVALAFSSNCSLFNLFSSYSPSKTTVKQTPVVQTKTTTPAVAQTKPATVTTPTQTFNQKQELADLMSFFDQVQQNHKVSSTSNQANSGNVVQGGQNVVIGSDNKLITNEAIVIGNKNIALSDYKPSNLRR